MQPSPFATRSPFSARNRRRAKWTFWQRAALALFILSLAAGIIAAVNL